MYTNKLTSVPLPHEFWRMGRSPEWLLFPAAGTDKYSEKQNNKKKKQALMARSNKPLVFFIWQIWAVFVCVQFILMM